MANINLRALEIARACVLNTQRRMCAILRIHTRGILHPFIIYTRTMREQNKYTMCIIISSYGMRGMRRTLAETDCVVRIQ